MLRHRTRNLSFGSYCSSLCLLLLLWLCARSSGANTCSKQPKKVIKAKKVSKKTTKKTASPLSLWFQCNPDTHNLEYNHNHHYRHEDSQPPWRYPYPRLLAGLTQFPLGANYSLALPTSMRRAMELGWRPQTSVVNNNNDSFCTWIHPEATRFELAFLDESLVSVKVLGQPPPTGTCSHQYFGTAGGIQLVFQNGWGVADGVYQVVSLLLDPNDHDDNDDDDTTKGIRILRYPRDVREATAPYSKPHAHIFHQDVWKRGSCVPAMGGYHYYSLPWSESKPVVPIYDTFGSGHLKAAVLALRYDNFDDNKPIIRGFDADGLLAMGIPFHCDFNNCNADHCVEAFSEMHKEWLLNLENDNNSLLQTLALTPVHLFWGVNPSDMDTWISCGPHLMCPPPSMHAPCSCCENAAKSHPRTNCPRPWPPIYTTPP